MNDLSRKSTVETIQVNSSKADGKPHQKHPNSKFSMSRNFIKSRNSDSESANCTWHLGIDPAIEAPKTTYFSPNNMIRSVI